MVAAHALPLGLHGLKLFIFLYCLMANSTFGILKSGISSHRMSQRLCSGA